MEALHLDEGREGRGSPGPHGAEEERAAAGCPQGPLSPSMPLGREGSRQHRPEARHVPSRQRDGLVCSCNVGVGLRPGGQLGEGDQTEPSWGQGPEVLLVRGAGSGGPVTAGDRGLVLRGPQGQGVAPAKATWVVGAGNSFPPTGLCPLPAA